MNLEMKKNKIIILSILLIFIISCSRAVDEDEYLNSVREVFPNSQIYSVNKYQYIVIEDSSRALLVKTMSPTSLKITSVEVLERKQ